MELKLFKIRKGTYDGDYTDRWDIYKLNLASQEYSYLTSRYTWRQAYDLVEPYAELYRKLFKL